MAEPTETLTVEEYATHRGVTGAAVRQWLASGRIEAVDPAARPRRIDRAAADARLAREAKPAETLPLFETPPAAAVEVDHAIPVALSGPKRLEAEPTTADGRPLLTLQEYAEHRRERELPGGTIQAVHDAVQRGRITAPVVAHPRLGRKVYMVDPELADREWAENTRPPASATEGPVAPGSAAAARQEQDQYKAALTRLQYEQAVGELLPVGRVKAEWGRIARTQREAFRAMPTRLAGRLVALLRERLGLSANAPVPVALHELEALVDREVAQTLSEIAQELTRGGPG